MEIPEITSNEKTSVLMIKSPIGQYATALSIVGFIGAVILAANSSGVDNGGNKLTNILAIFSYIPNWIGTLLYQGSLFIFLMQIMKCMEPITTALRNVIKCCLVTLVLFCIFSIMSNATPYNDTIAIFNLIVAIIYLIANIIVAIKLISSYSGDIATLGWLFIAETPITILYAFLPESTYILLSFAALVVDYFIFAYLRSLFIKKE